MLIGDPGLILTFGSGTPDYDAHRQLIQAGAPVVVASDFVDGNALGQPSGSSSLRSFTQEGQAMPRLARSADEYAALVNLSAA